MNRWPFHVFVYLGLFLLLSGLLVGMVEVFVLSPQATQFLHHYLGFGGGSAVVLGEAGFQGQYRPAPWLDYALLSAGAVLFIHGWLLKRSQG